MKEKKIERKLTLNKNTVADLDMEELNAVKGGYTKLADCVSIPIRRCSINAC